MSVPIFGFVEVFRRIVCARHAVWLGALIWFTAGPVFANNSAPAPQNAHALVYSVSAAELFFQPPAGYVTHITHNGRDLGRTDARSLWLDNLDQSIQHRFELVSVEPGSGGQPNASQSAVITVFTGGFSPPVFRVDAQIQRLTVTTPPLPSPPPPSVGPAVEPTNNQYVSAESRNAVDVLSSACNVSNVSELVSCVRQAAQHDVINIRSDLSCNEASCCPSGQALINLRGVSQLEILGNGKRLLRTGGQRRCSLIDVVGGSDITFKHWILDDDVRVPGCQVNDRCPRMVHVRNARQVAFDDVTVQHGKGYTIYVDGVNGFKFNNSRLFNSGVLGLYFGHGNTPSTNIHIENSNFADNQTNALAMLGVVGSHKGANRILGNRFLRNHRKGQWQVAPQYGTGFTGGGQVYLADASGVTFENNVIRDGYCSNCFVQRRARSGVTGLELGIPGKPSVKNALIRNNVIEHHDGFGIHSNRNSALSSSVEISGNRLSTNVSGISVQGGVLRNNAVSDTRWFQSFEGGNDLNSYFSVEAQCPGARVQRICGSPDARFGSCLTEMSTVGDCAVSPVKLTSNAIAVKLGKQVQASAWVKGGHGLWCLVFSNSSGWLAEQCVTISPSTKSAINTPVGTPELSLRVPENATQVTAEMRVSRAANSIVIDDVKLSIQP